MLCEAPAGSTWSDRKGPLDLYGEGPVREALSIWRESLALRIASPSRGSRMSRDLGRNGHAMLCWRIVITTDVAGHAEIVEDGVTGFVADFVARGAGTRERFWERRDEAEAMGKAADTAIDTRRNTPLTKMRD